MILGVMLGCQTVPVSERKALNFIPESLEISLGNQSYDEVLKNEKISSEPHINALVTRVGKRIAAVSGRTDYEWEFKVIDSEVMNAFCLPGGKIAVYRGILPLAKNEAGLATVLGHEITHAIARHGGQRISANIAMVGGLVVLQGTVLEKNENAPMIMALLGLGSQVGVMLPYGRMQETEADEVGQILMAKAGYDPAESSRFWQRFGNISKGSKVPELLSDHPSDEAREANMKDKLPRALTEYQKAPNHYGLGESF
ncbi:MAG: M48 family metallopeptidase [Bacteriovoracia bacterium]